MDTQPGKLKQLFQKLLQGTATEEEKKRVAEYLQQKDTDIDPDLLLPYEQWAATAEDPLPPGLQERLFERIQAAGSEAYSPVKRGSFIRRNWWYSAAAALLLIITGYWFFEKSNTGRHPQWLTVTAAKGHLTTFFLPDSTKVYLNAGSEISYPAQFSAHERPVQLTGEAFFEVTHNAAKPFTVQSAAVRTTVLGTAFNVQAYSGDTAISVTVTNGRVKVATADAAGATGNTAVLTPGQRAVYGKRTGSLMVNAADTLIVSGWKEHRLIFDDASLAEILTLFERQYNVTFRCETPAMLACKYSATFNQLSLEEALNKLTLLGEVEFVKQGAFMVVKGKPCR